MSAMCCPKCSTITPENAQFCSVCGTFLSIQSEHPTLLTGLVDQDDVDTGATVLAERAEHAEDVSISSMSTERGMMELADEGLTVAASSSMYAAAVPRMYDNDDTPTMPGVLAQFDQATPAPRPLQPGPLQGERRQSETIPATRLALPQQSNLAPVRYPRSGAIDSQKHNQKSLLASSRYFLMGTGLLLLIGVIALVTYPYLVKGNMASMPATMAYARPALIQTPHAVATPNPTPAPVATQSATAYSATGPMPTPTVIAPPPAACLHVNMHGLSFNATSGGNAPAPQTITLSNACATGAWSVRWDAPWLSASPIYSGTVNGTTPVVINVASANLAANSYTGHIVFSAGPSHTTVTVTLTIAQAANAVTSCIKLDQNNLNFSASPQQNPASQAIMVTNCGSAGTVAATVSTSYISQSLPSKQSNQPPMQYNNGTNWLTTSPGSQLAAGNTLPIHVNVTTLGPGIYTSSIAITITTSDGKTNTHTVNVTFTVQGNQ